MKKRILVLFNALLFTGILNAQNSTFNHFDFGVGMGANYGGFGFSMAFAPVPIVSIEGCFGYNLADPNVGGAINLHIIPKDNTKTYGLALKSMYGYNAVLVTTFGDMDSKSFYGLSFGLSNELRFGSSKKSGINVDLLIPLRSGEVDKYYDELIDYGYEMTPLLPFSISIGYHIEF